MRHQVQELDRKVLILERKQELEKEAATEQGEALPTVSLGANGLSVRPAESNFNYEQADFDGGTCDFLKKGEKVVLTRAPI